MSNYEIIIGFLFTLLFFTNIVGLKEQFKNFFIDTIKCRLKMIFLKFLIKLISYYCNFQYNITADARIR
jgi:hypothetical protein